MNVKPVEVIHVPVPPPARSILAEKRAEIPTKPISERAFAMSVLRKQDDHTTKSAEAERLLVAELRASNDSLLAVANPPVAITGSASHEIEVAVDEAAVATSAQVCHIDITLPVPINARLSPRTCTTWTSNLTDLIPLSLRRP